MYCDKCGTKKIADETYCHNCGNVFGSRREKEKKKSNNFLKWLLGIVSVIIVIYVSLLIGKTIEGNENESERISQLEIENKEIKAELAEQKDEFEETISKILESINAGKDDFIHELEGISEKLKEDIINLINSLKEDSKEKEDKE